LVSKKPATELCAFWQTQNASLEKSRKQCFKRSNGSENSISALWLSQNKTRVKSKSFVPSGPNSMRNHFLPPGETKNVSWTRSRKWCFKWLNIPENSLSPFWMSQKRLW
jgi:hypothetical protein